MVLFEVSLIVAFISGIVALAMPCCFSVLLPSYFASSFKRRLKILQMTFIFATGISVVLLPISLGASTLAHYIGSGHSIIFMAGGFLMILIGLLSLWGHSMLPQIRVPTNLKRSDMPSVFTLGVFSGVASSCCAPVLAGIAVLTGLSSSWVEAFSIGIFYVLGMVFPLIMIAMVWDQSKVSKINKILVGKTIHFSLFRKDVEIHSSRLISGLMFTVMGTVTVILGFTNTMLPSFGSDIFNIYQGVLEKAITNVFQSPFIWFGPIIVLPVIAVIWIKIAKRHNNDKQHDENQFEK